MQQYQVVAGTSVFDFNPELADTSGKNQRYNFIIPKFA